jgi:hypothetical protein
MHADNKVRHITVPDTQKFALFVQHNTVGLSDADTCRILHSVAVQPQSSALRITKIKTGFYSESVQSNFYPHNLFVQHPY